MKMKTSIGMVLISVVLGAFLVSDPSVMTTNAQEAEESAATNSVSSIETNVPAVQTVLDSTLPEGVSPDSPFAQLVRMVQAGVDQGVILAYIKKSPRFFELDADDIIYLTDLGTPPEIIEAAMARDQVLIDEGIGVQTDVPETSADADATEEEPPEVTVNEFQDALSPYGSWVYVEGYGRCWRPTVVVYNSSWEPYCDNGRWVYTDSGWYWMSNYSWGWATFHYGRWFRHARYGWCWWPDTVWAPSWVCWRYNSSYCGWAPLPPYTVYRPGVGIVCRGTIVSAGFNFNLGYGAFTFVSNRNFCDPQIRRHRISRSEIKRIYDRTEGHHRVDIDARRHTIINRGIPAQHIASASHREITPVSIRYGRNPVRRSGRFETFNRDRSSVVVTRPRATRHTGAAASSSGTGPNVNRSRTSRSADPAPVQNPRRSRTRPTPNGNRTTVPPNTNTRRSGSTPEQSTPPAARPGNGNHRPAVRQNNGTPPATSPATPRRSRTNRSKPQPQTRNREPRPAATPAAPQTRSNRPDPQRNNSSRPAQVRKPKKTPRAQRSTQQSKRRSTAPSSRSKKSKKTSDT